jgi:S-layer protein (TIGR01564 family)
VQQAVKIQNSVTKMEAEVNTATLDRNLIVIGGPCANSLVADLLDMSSSAGACDTDFKALYPTEGVIKVVNDAFGSGKMAMVVAGVNRDATRALAVKVMQGTVSYGK